MNEKNEKLDYYSLKNEFVIKQKERLNSKEKVAEIYELLADIEFASDVYPDNDKLINLAISVRLQIEMLEYNLKTQESLTEFNKKINKSNQKNKEKYNNLEKQYISSVLAIMGILVTIILGIFSGINIITVGMNTMIENDMLNLKNMLLLLVIPTTVLILAIYILLKILKNFFKK